MVIDEMHREEYAVRLDDLYRLMAISKQPLEKEILKQLIAELEAEIELLKEQA